MPSDPPEQSLQTLLSDIRAKGWSVAVHNDYVLGGAGHTFWLFTKDNYAVKGEARTDLVALQEIRAKIRELERVATEKIFTIDTVVSKIFEEGRVSGETFEDTLKRVAMKMAKLLEQRLAELER